MYEELGNRKLEKLRSDNANLEREKEEASTELARIETRRKGG